MTKLQFRVLYQQFLFRMVDLEILSPDGDVKRILGQFAGVLIWISSLLMLGGFLGAGSAHGTGGAHFLIATTMLAVGLFAVLSWDATFPDRRDVLVLGPLPVRPRTLFLAKVASLGAALSLTVAAFNGPASISWAFLILPPPGSGMLGALRCYVVFWVAVLAAGAFTFCVLLTLQGLAGQLPRRWFLRVSPVLQMGAFVALFWNFFFEPAMGDPRLLGLAQSRGLLDGWPSYWFLGLFEALNGWPSPAFGPLALRALAGLSLAAFGASTAFLLSYLRTIRKIVEEPDIVPGTRGGAWLPPFGNAVNTAVVQFAVRSLMRSRQHRVILGFYMGLGFAIVAMFVRSDIRGTAHLDVVGLMALSFLMLCLAVAGVRIVMAMPADLRANWIFRVTTMFAPPEYAKATRRSMLVLAAAPVWAVAAPVFFAFAPWRTAAAHMLVLVIVGLALVDVALLGFRKIPFTCSYLPGKSHFNMVFLIGAGVFLAAFQFAQYEAETMRSAFAYGRLAATLAAAAALLRWRALAMARDEEARVQFEESMTPVVQSLGLNRDGVVPLG